VRHWPLYYSAGADAALDRPAFVRAGSGLATIGGRLAIIQDDAHFLAVVDIGRHHVDAIALPAGYGGGRQFDDLRGNRHWKLDLEACASLIDEGRELLVAFGSGSSPAREHILLVAWPAEHACDVRLLHAPEFYAALRADAGFAGSELNIEGAALLSGDSLRLWQRGNGAACQGCGPVNAACDISWRMLRAHLNDPASPPPTPQNVTQYDLGRLDGVPLSFTDAAVRGHAIFFTATAEASPNTVEDGPVAGSVLGQIDAGGNATWTVLCDPHGGRLNGKVEGLCFDAEDANRAWILIDRDDPLAPAELCQVQL
jgi:hypothetical protein